MLMASKDIVGHGIGCLIVPYAYHVYYEFHASFVNHPHFCRIDSAQKNLVVSWSPGTPRVVGRC